MAIKSGSRVYVVVDVMRGIAVDGYCFQRIKDAQACAEQLRKGRKPKEDDVQVFEKRLDVAETDF